MHLSSLNLRNFRKYGTKEDGPGLALTFLPGINLLVGENDSGKSCVIDAIHYVLFDESHGWVHLDEEDFHEGTTVLSIECLFRNLNDNEAKTFLEWLSFDKETGNYYLRCVLRAEKKQSGIFSETRAGADADGIPLTKQARQYLCATYLKPLRDAQKELSPGRRSRLAQILASHPVIGMASEEGHPIVEAVSRANEEIRDYFTAADGEGNVIYQRLDNNLQQLRRERTDLSPNIDLDTPRLRRILEKLSLSFSDDNLHPGLGSQNLLFIAAELLLLKQENEWLKLALIEEIEAHLDPQSQLRVMQFFDQEASDVQLIVTTHSPILASVIDLKGLTIFRNGNAFPMRPGATNLAEGDYAFLRRFLDATKANLFFATGILIVEGPAENILLPTLAKILNGRTLAKSGVSIVNVGGVALLRYARIFHRRDGAVMDIPVACIADRDIPPDEALAAKLIKEERETIKDFTVARIAERLDAKKYQLESVDVRLFVSPHWTLEYDLACGALAPLMHAAVCIAKEAKDGEVTIDAQRIQLIALEAATEVAAWHSSGLSTEDIACKVYGPLAKKTVSKVAAAEFLADLLEQRNQADGAETKRMLETDPALQYLRDAIFYVTGSEPDGQYDD